MSRKTCSKCNVEKAVSEFGNNKNYKDGLAPTCRTCRSVHQKELANKNKERLEGTRKYRDRVCEYCGITFVEKSKIYGRFLNKRFCSEKCTANHQWHKTPENKIINHNSKRCLCCDKPLNGRQKRNKYYCSKECSDRHFGTTEMGREKARRLSEIQIGKKMPDGYVSPLSGSHLSEEHKEACRRGWKNFKESSKYDDYTKKLSEAMTGREMTWGDKVSKTRIENGVAKLDKNPNWNGGTSFAPYPQAWNEELKESIRKRDGYICQECGGTAGTASLDVHHIDYNKDNCSPNNLISLCHRCHPKTNSPKKRKHFTKRYKERIIEEVKD